MQPIITRETDQKVKLLGAQLTAEELRPLEEVAKLDSVIAPVIALPNAHKKSYLELPTSSVVATSHHLIPETTAASLGCVLGAIEVDVAPEKFTEEIFQHVVQEIKQGYVEYRSNIFANLLIWLGVKKIPKSKIDPTKEDLVKIFKFGAQALTQELGNLEYSGNVMTDDDRKNFDPRFLPRSAYIFHNNIGYGFFDHSHFLEVYSSESNPSKTYFIYHACGGTLPFFVGRYYSNRIKHGFKESLTRVIPKIIFHFASLDGLANFGFRLKNYFVKGWHELDINTSEGRRAMLAYKAGINYSHAHNYLLSKRLASAINTVLGDQVAKLYWQALHNTILPSSDGQLIHRHGSVAVVDNKPLIITGHNNTTSHLALGTDGAKSTWYSADHNASAIVKRMEQEGTLTKTGGQTIMFEGPAFRKTVIEQVSSEGPDFLIKTLQENGVLKNPIRLKPLYVYKDI